MHEQAQPSDDTTRPGELVILVGMQGCGKTYYCRTVLADHVRISQDDGPRRFGGVVDLLEATLREGAPRIVVDRTNPLRWQREIFVRLARQYGYRTRIVYFDVPADLCRERITQRTGHPTLTPERMQEAMNRYLSCLEAPCPEECDELVVVQNSSQ